MSALKTLHGKWFRWIPPVILLVFLLSGIILFRTGTAPQWLLLASTALASILGFQLFRGLMRQYNNTANALEEGEYYSKALSDLSTDLHAVIDVKTNSFIYANPAVEDILGFQVKECTKKSVDFFKDRIHPEDMKNLEGPWERLKTHEPGIRPDKERIHDDLFRIRNKWEEYRWLRMRTIVLRRELSGAPQEILLVAHDITMERALDALLAQAQEFESTQLLARQLSHDLNNLVMGIAGHVELATSHPEKNNVKERLQAIGQIAERAADVCQQMVTYAGQGRARLQKQHINQAIKDSLPRLQTMSPDNLHIALELGRNLPPVEADAKQLKQILLSLVLQAGERLGNREGEVHISTFEHTLTDDSLYANTGLRGHYVCLQVTDDGPRLSEEELHDLFNASYRLRHPGHGLGMHTVEGLVKAQQGGLHITNTSNGLVFRIFFPLADQAKVGENDEITLVNSSNGAILLVDDEPSVRAILREGLEGGGYQVLEACNGIEGLNQIAKQRNAIKMVLLDLSMPRMGGLEFFQEIRTTDPELPVVLMSGYHASDAMEGFQGLAGFLPKPCSVKEVLGTAKRLVG